MSCRKKLSAWHIKAAQKKIIEEIKKDGYFSYGWKIMLDIAYETSSGEWDLRFLAYDGKGSFSIFDTLWKKNRFGLAFVRYR